MYAALRSALRGPESVPPTLSTEALPQLTLIISAHNEERVIEAKLDNALALSYPAEKLEILVASDGSTDRTNAIVAAFGERGVRLLASPRNRGKSVLLNDAIAAASHDLLVFTDANSLLSPDALIHLASRFAEEKVGFVCGALQYLQRRHGTAERGELAYWEAEARVKRHESTTGSLVAGNGSIIAARREALVVLDGATANDFHWCVAARYMGWKAVFEPRAIAKEYLAGTISKEYRRKVRISMRGLELHRQLFRLPEVCGTKAPLVDRVALFGEVVAKKLMRYLTFPAIVLMMIVGLAGSGLTVVAAGALWATVLLACALSYLHRSPMAALVRPLPDPAYPLAMAAASLTAIYRSMIGIKAVRWSAERDALEAEMVRAVSRKPRTDP
jgi:cellulose synthase/poly-beta-1,6-N-acetylglucosamine synthase-like glycosyltransferase